MIEQDEDQIRRLNDIYYEELEDKSEIFDADESESKNEEQAAYRKEKVSQMQEEDEDDKIDPEKLNEFDRKFYDFFENYKLSQFQTLNEEELKKIGEEYSTLIDGLLEKNLDEIYQYINETQLLAFRLYADWISVMLKKDYISQNDPVIKRNMTFLQENLFTFLSPTPSSHPKQYFSCIHNYAIKVFTPDQLEQVIPIIKKNLQKIPIVELSRFGVLFQKNKDFFKQIISEIMRKFPKATILEFSHALDLFKISDIQQNFVFTDQFLHFYSKQWQNLNIHQVMSLTKVLVYFKESDFNKYFYMFEETIRRNIFKFKIYQIRNLVKFYHSLQKQAKTVYQNPITYELNKRQTALLIKKAMFNVEKLQPKGTKPLIPRSILTKIKEYYYIYSEIQYFRQCPGLPKSQAENIITEIIQKNPQYEQLRNEIKGQKIHSFVAFSSLIKQLQIQDKEIISAISDQYEKSYGSLEQTLDQEITVFKNFQQFNLYYPFIKEVQQKLLENIDTYDFTNISKSFLAYELVCLSSLYAPNKQLIEAIEQKFLEHFLNQIQKESSNILKLATYLPPNTFKQFINGIIHKPSLTFVKQSFYRYIVTLTKQGKVDPQLFMSNLQAVNLFKQSQQIFYKFMKVLGQNQFYSQMDQELLVTLNCISSRYFSDKNLKIIAKKHCIENQTIKFLVQNSEKTLHINLVSKESLFINKLDTVTPNEQFKNIYLKQYLNYEYITYLEFCTKDRQQLVKDLLTKYFRN